MKSGGGSGLIELRAGSGGSTDGGNMGAGDRRRIITNMRNESAFSSFFIMSVYEKCVIE